MNIQVAGEMLVVEAAVWTQALRADERQREPDRQAKRSARSRQPV